MTGATSESGYTSEDFEALHRRVKQKEREVYEESLKEHIRKAIAKSGLADAIKKLTFKSFKVDSTWQRQMLNNAWNYAKNPEGWLMFCGQSGSGKTHLCTAVAGRFLRHGIPVKRLRWRLDSAKLKANYTSAEEAHNELMRYINAPCLFIDDLFKGSLTETDVKVAFALIDGRYSWNSKTLITTELTVEELLAIDEAIAGRIVEKCGNNLITIEKNRDKNIRLKNVNRL